jgi:hypothetical protein
MCELKRAKVEPPSRSARVPTHPPAQSLDSTKSAGSSVQKSSNSVDGGNVQDRMMTTRPTDKHVIGRVGSFRRPSETIIVKE